MITSWLANLPNRDKEIYDLFLLPGSFVLSQFGVHEMQIYLGEDTDNNGVANRWMSPGTAGLDMTRVVSVRVHLLVRTNANAISSGPQAYYFNNAQQAAVDDGQIRREYSVTVALRNPT